MKISVSGIALIKRFEGLELEAYKDIAGVWTIGYGHTASARPGLVWTEQIAEAALRQDLDSREDAIGRLFSGPLNQNKFDALVSLIFNIGYGALQNSTVRRRINNGESDFSIAEAWRWWNKARVDGVLTVAPGLVRRREAEIALYLTPVDTATFDESPDDGVVKEPGRSAEVEPSIVAPETPKNSRSFLKGLLCGKS